VAGDQSLSAARYIMRTRRVSHLPVFESGKLVGVLCDRELAAIELLPGADLLKVEDAMSPVTYVVPENALLQWVAVDMAGGRSAPPSSRREHTSSESSPRSMHSGRWQTRCPRAV